MRRSIPLILLAAFVGPSLCAAAPEPFALAKWIKPVPRHSVLREAGYYVWGGSVVEDGGKYHMFYSRWHTSPWTFADGWLFDSEICHAVADAPGGPFAPTGVVLGKRPNDTAIAFWDSQTQHNPHIRKFGGKFHLYYMASVDPGASVWPGITQRNRIQRNQRIGVVVADTLQDLVAGNFARPSTPLLAPRYSTSAATDRTTNPVDYASNRIVNNQSVVERPDGTYELICKSNWPQAPAYGHGRWLAASPTGPFTEMTGPIFSDQGREDENHWFDAARDRYFLICKNFSNNGTELLESADSVTWVSKGIQFGKLIQWADGVSEPVDALERPQLLRGADGEPVMLYMAARRALGGGAYEAFNVHIRLAPPAGSATSRPLTDPVGIKTSGLPIQAVNLGGSVAVTLNGLEFSPSGTNLASLDTTYGFTQAGGASGAALGAGLIETAYTGDGQFEDFLDTMVWQTGTPQTGANLTFQLRNLDPARSYRLQLFMAESRSTPSRHGPQLVKVGKEISPVFDFGPTSALVAVGAHAIVVETTFRPDAATVPVTLVQEVPNLGGLQVSAFAVHDVSLPTGGRIELANGNGVSARVSWLVVPGFAYTVERSSDLCLWESAANGVFQPTGSALTDLIYTDAAPAPAGMFYRLVRNP